MPEGRITYRDLGQAIESMRKEVKTDINDVHKQISSLSERIENNFVTQKEFYPVKKDVADLQGSLKWLVITILGTVVVAVLRLVVNMGGEL